MEDVVPELLEKIRRDIAEEIEQSEIIRKYYDLVKSKTANYAEANKAAKEVGNILAKAYQKNLSSSVLPDGKMYYNIAKRIVGETLTEGYERAADFAEAAQIILNKKANIGISAIRTKVSEDGINGFLNRISAENSFDTIKWILNAPVVNFTVKAIDDSVQKNVEFQYESGLGPKIIRRSSGHCCEWCNKIAGVYEYPDLPKDIYRRHDNCDCTVEYDPASGKKMQNVWSKKWKYKAK